MRTALTVAVLTAMSIIAPGEDVIDALAEKMQGKTPEEVHALIVARLGDPTRDIGSGEHIEQWDVDGGALIFHRGSGPTFEKGGKTRWLIRTNNPAASCLIGGYMMTTVPDPRNHGNCFWLGDLMLTADGRYRYTDGGSNRDQRAGQERNYFILHPVGTARIEYAKGVTAETRLEDLKDGVLVATVRFSAPDDAGGKSYEVVANGTARNLTLKGPEFQMSKGWVSYWK